MEHPRVAGLRARAVPEWDAEAYVHLNQPQRSWAGDVLRRLRLAGAETVVDAGCGTGDVTRQLIERLPRGRVVAVDRSATMLGAARGSVGSSGGVLLVRADLRHLPLRAACDLVFSSAVLHWVPDHDAVFRNFYAVLRPGGRVEAQCGGAGNLQLLLEQFDSAVSRPPYRSHMHHWRHPWHFPSAEVTARRLHDAGFVDVETSLAPAPTRFGTRGRYRDFLQRVIFFEHLARLPAPLGERLLETLVAEAEREGSLVVDFWRLDISARRP